jgi:hypothetical protein
MGLNLTSDPGRPSLVSSSPQSTSGGFLFGTSELSRSGHSIWSASQDEQSLKFAHSVPSISRPPLNQFSAGDMAPHSQISQNQSVQLVTPQQHHRTYSSGPLPMTNHMIAGYPSPYVTQPSPTPQKSPETTYTQPLHQSVPFMVMYNQGMRPFNNLHTRQHSLRDSKTVPGVDPSPVSQMMHYHG